MIDGMFLTRLDRVACPVGDIYRLLKPGDSGYAGFGEAYCSAIHPGAVKAWKRHRRMTLNIIVVAGSIRFGVYDERPESITCGQAWGMILRPYSFRLTIPPGLWFGFQGWDINVSILLNLADMPHDPCESDTAPTDRFPWPI